MAYINGKKILQVARTQNVFGTMEEITDAQGNLRFVEIDGIPTTATGINITYCKASLSGTHLMIVVAGSVANGKTLSNGDTMARYTLPQWIYDKIYPVFATNNIEIKNATFYANDYSSQQGNFIFAKSTGTNIVILKGGNLTLSADRSFRLQFDLLIDNEVEE